jgi:hypothetical protein
VTASRVFSVAVAVASISIRLAAQQPGVAALPPAWVPPPAPQYVPPPADPADQIEHLAQLHASGVLTDDEFAAAKAKAIGT